MWHRVASLSELPVATGREVMVGGRIVAIFKSGDLVTAMDGICPHAGGPLGEGKLQDGIVTCPWHGWQFHAQTGHHCLTPQIRQNCFPVKVEGDDVFVELP